MNRWVTEKAYRRLSRYLNCLRLSPLLYSVPTWCRRSSAPSSPPRRPKKALKVLRQNPPLRRTRSPLRSNRRTLLLSASARLNAITSPCQWTSLTVRSRPTSLAAWSQPDPSLLFWTARQRIRVLTSSRVQSPHWATARALRQPSQPPTATPRFRMCRLTAATGFLLWLKLRS